MIDQTHILYKILGPNLKKAILASLSVGLLIGLLCISRYPIRTLEEALLCLAVTIIFGFITFGYICTFVIIIRFCIRVIYFIKRPSELRSIVVKYIKNTFSLILLLGMVIIIFTIYYISNSTGGSQNRSSCKEIYGYEERVDCLEEDWGSNRYDRP
jgi:hypothetical protein